MESEGGAQLVHFHALEKRGGPLYLPSEGPESAPLPSAAGLAAGRDKPRGQPHSLWSVSNTSSPGMRLQPEPWPLGSVPTGVLGQLSLFAPVLPAFLPSTSGYAEMCLGLGQPSPHAQGRARYSMDTSTLPLLVLAPRRPLLLPRRGFPYRRRLLWSFLCSQFLYDGVELYFAPWESALPLQPPCQLSHAIRSSP